MMAEEPGVAAAGDGRDAAAGQGEQAPPPADGAHALLAAAREYGRQGWAVVPVARRAKAPLHAGWETRHYRDDELADAFPPGINLGVLTGASGAGLVDVDCDAPEAQRAAALLLPPTGRIHGRPGAPRSHYWYQIAGERSASIKPARYRFGEGTPTTPADTRTMLVELRGDGCQTLVPPSVHPGGATLRWETADAPGVAPGVVAEDVLRAAVGRVAACALLARYWPARGARDEAALALCGMLLAGGWDVAAADNFTRAVAGVAGDEEWFRRNKAAATARRRAAGEPVMGRHALAERLRAEGARVVSVASSWLGLAPEHASGQRDGASRGASYIRLSQVREVALEWLWPGHLPLGGITMLDGDPGLGKSLVSLDLAARVVRGLPMPDGAAGMAGGVVLLSAEDPLAPVIKPRLRAAGVTADELDRIVGLPSVTEVDAATGMTSERGLLLPADVPVIAEAARAVDARLVVIDPYMAYLGPRVNSWRDQDMRATLAPLQRLAEELRLTVLILRHVNKATGTSALHRGGGSIGIIGAARAGAVMGRDPDDPEGARVIAFPKNNYTLGAPSLRLRVRSNVDGLPAIEWLGESPYTADQLVNQPVEGAGNRQPADATLTGRAVAWLRPALAEGPRPSAELIAAAGEVGITPGHLQRARLRLAVVVTREGFGATGRSLWALPPDSPADPS